MIAMRAFAVLAILLLAGCGDPASEETAPDQAQAEAPVKQPAESGGDEGETVVSDARPIPALDGEGLRMVIPSGATRLIAFGSGRQVVENALGRSLGKGGTRSSNRECGAGPMEFSTIDGLTLNFQEGKFVGWNIDGTLGLTTIDGMGVGSNRAVLEQSRTLAMQDSTLGKEFRSGGIGGFLDEEGDTVTMLYAGTQCFFR